MMILAPLAPIGWPNAIAPPFTFTFSRLNPAIFSLTSTTDANASFTSNKSISSTDSPVFVKSRLMASPGALASSHASNPTDAKPSIAASGLTCSLRGFFL